MQANLTPSFNASIEAGSSKNIKEGGASSRSFGSSIGLSYELDLWQKLANSKDAAMFEAEASKFDLEASKLSVINSVADAYFQILYLNESIKTYEQILEIYNELNKIVGLKFELGKEESLSLKQINSQLLNAQNNIESAKSHSLNLDRNLNKFDLSNFQNSKSMRSNWLKEEQNLRSKTLILNLMFFCSERKTKI